VTLDALLLAAGLVVIIRGGDLFVSASVSLAERWRVPRVVVGSTLVSVATTSPELVVSVLAGMRGEAGLALGNALGSCITNIGLILGVTAWLRHVDVHPSALRLPLGGMLLLGVFLFALTLDLTLSRGEGALLVVLGLAYLGWDFARHWRDREPRDVAEAAAIEAEVVSGRRWLGLRWGPPVQFVVGAALVVLGSRLLVDAAVSLAYAVGVRPLIVGLTVVAVGTSLPELVTAVTSARREVSDLGLGNVLGANILNLSLIPGAAAAIAPVGLDRLGQGLSFPALLLVMGVLAWAILGRGRLSRRLGLLLLAAYAAYLVGVGLTSLATA
jgi:cation:H+ antiporter